MDGTGIEALHAREFSTLTAVNPPVGAVSFVLSFSDVVSNPGKIWEIMHSEKAGVFMNWRFVSHDRGHD
jgi:hypothetical protein